MNNVFKLFCPLFQYADPVADLLDKWGVFRARLFRESCVFYRGNYVKDLNKLGRALHKVVIIDNSPASYIFHPDNAVCLFLLYKINININFNSIFIFLKYFFQVPVNSWFDDMTDKELLHLIPFFEKLSKMENVYPVICNINHMANAAAAAIAVQSQHNSSDNVLQHQFLSTIYLCQW